MAAGMAAGIVGRFMVMVLLAGRGVVVGGGLRMVTGMRVVVMHLLCGGGMFVATGRQRRIGCNGLQGQGQHQQPGSDLTCAFHEVGF